MRKPLRVAFIHCPNPLYADTQNYGAQFMPVWAYTLASHIPKDGSYDLALYDTRLEPIDQVMEADVFLFSGINQDYEAIVNFHGTLKKKYPNSRFIVGGPICWSFNTAGDIEKLNFFDHIFIGDGEDFIVKILENVAQNKPIEKIVNNKIRFPVSKALPFYRPFLDATIGRYYGAVIEVSRGCPFLCEFCDIRILPDNNRSHTKSPDLIISELDHIYDLGVRQVLLACDNFIGDVAWAETVVDKIIDWSQKTGKQVSLYTWLTINLNKYPELMKKMRIAGFDMLFIGIESFSSNSLFETAKVQNTAVDLTRACRLIQSYGFIIVAGLIFGFDSDGEDCFDVTLKGLQESGLISGDPSLLTALPGTPLYKRMKESNRLRQVRYGLGGYKYQTNIRYLKPRKKIIDGYKYFVKNYSSGFYQYKRLQSLFESLQMGNFIPLQSKGYGDPIRFAKMLLRNPAALFQFAQRMIRFASRPMNIYYAFKGFMLMLYHRPKFKNAFTYFQFWLFAWTNTVLKYAFLRDEDFDIESVDENFKLENLLPASYTDDEPDSSMNAKATAQRRFTVSQLSKLAKVKIEEPQ